MKGIVGLQCIVCLPSLHYNIKNSDNTGTFTNADEASKETKLKFGQIPTERDEVKKRKMCSNCELAELILPANTVFHSLGP